VNTKLNDYVCTSVKIAKLSVTEVAALSAAGWAWSRCGQHMLQCQPAAGSMQADLAAAVGAMSMGVGGGTGCTALVMTNFIIQSVWRFFVNYVFRRLL